MAFLSFLCPIRGSSLKRGAMSSDDVEQILLDILHEAQFNDAGAGLTRRVQPREIEPPHDLIEAAMMDLYTSRPPQGQFAAI